MDKSVQNHRANKIRKIFSDVLTVLIIIVSVFAIAISAVTIHINKTYDRFFVDGQSMYPILNKDAEREDGTKYGVGGGNLDGEKAYHIDYGLYDSSAKTINELKRFDIVICSFTKEEDETLIKRVIGFPGETIKFVNGGHLQIKSSDGSFEDVEQPIEEKYLAGIYPVGEIKVPENNYYVCGDNRGHSSDSRDSVLANQKFIDKDGLYGKAVWLIGYCSVKQISGEDKYDVDKINYTWPRKL